MSLKLAAFQDAIKDFTEAQLTRFKEIFAAVAQRVLRNGGDEDEAQGIALGIALSAARNYTPAPQTASLEEDKHYFTILAPQQLGRGRDGAITGNEFSLDFLTANLDIAKMIAVGNTVNQEHDHGKPVGVITDVLLASEVEGMEVDPDIPLVYVASYFKDTPDEVKGIDSVSAEWAHFDINGRDEAFPSTFAVTNTPLNGKVQGLKKLANIEIGQGKAYKEDTPHEKTDTMSKEPNPAEQASDFDAKAEVETLRAAMTEIKEREKAATEELATLKASLAAVAGKEDKPDEVTAADVEAQVASLRKEVETAQSIVAEVKEAALDKEAEDFAASLVKAGKIASDTTEKWAGLYKKDSETAKDLSSGLTASLLGENDGKAILDLPEGNETLAALDKVLLKANLNQKEAS